MTTGTTDIGFHDQVAEQQSAVLRPNPQNTRFSYSFSNFFHPFLSELIQQLNQNSVPALMDAAWQKSLEHPFFNELYRPQTQNGLAHVESYPKQIDVAVGGPYTNYNWELFFHLPLTIAVHLSKTQRFAEAQRWFHFVFDPTSNDQTVAPPGRYWKFLAFRQPDGERSIDEIVRLLSTIPANLSPLEREAQGTILAGYEELRNKPFQPHVVARTRPLAYQYSVVMKYLDNLIAWGDHLFELDTVEAINEATQLYVLAANLLGPRPQRVPSRGKTRPKTFAQLRAGLGPIGDALVELEGQFPLNLNPLFVRATGRQTADPSNVLFSIGRTLYFCIPRNEKLLGYWDKVADRLFKIRHCMDMTGVVRPLPLFDPPIDPGMLVKAAAAGIDVGSIVSGLNQPVGPLRALPLIQKALELCSELRSLGGALLSAIEKGDGEQMSLLRQKHEMQIQTLTQEVRFLQWKAAQEATTSLLTTRGTVLERLRYYQRQLNLPPDENASENIDLDHSELTETNFDQAYGTLVKQYGQPLTFQPLPQINVVGNTSAGQQSGASGKGKLYLNPNEHVDLNDHADRAFTARASAAGAEAIASVLAAIPDFNVDGQFWGVGGHCTLTGGSFLSNIGRAVSSGFNIWAQVEEWQGHHASKTASYERRADDWILQHNLTAHELMQIGRQILTSLIAEQVAHHEYRNIQRQIENAQEVHQFLQGKFTNEELYLWMQGEISRLYYDYYRLAFDIARKAERTMKQEIMRPELDAQDFVKFNYWDGGRKGLLSGEALHLDVKRMELAYHQNNKREYELVKHVSLRQLNPLALLSLKVTGSCQVTVPEWLFDLDNPGHYMRRIKNVSLTIPAVTGPYTAVNCSLTLLKSSLRKSPLPKDENYARQIPEDDRFVDYIGTVQSIVTSTAQNDSGLFETNLRDERFLPFEGAGAESTWKLQLPKDYPNFDYATISDVILHLRYTARPGVDPAKVKVALDELLEQASQSNLTLLFSLRRDFPTEWAAFANGGSEFAATIRREHFPYFTQGRTITIAGLDLYGPGATDRRPVDATPAATALRLPHGHYTLRVPRAQVPPSAEVFVTVRYAIEIAP